MADERVVSEIITEFLLNTCGLCPRLSKHGAQAADACAQIATKTHPGDDAEAVSIPLITGSVAEFYIEPMLPHVGDVDVMYYHSNQLAIPRGHPPPTQLPDEFSNYVRVFEIVDSHLPGYVYLQLRYLLTECVEDEKYRFTEYERRPFLSNDVYGHGVYIHGPAALAVSNDTSMLSVDSVQCVRCLSWPSQAADWPTRHRNYDWPDTATVDRVVNNGCDVVAVAHRQCREDEWMGKNQWRLSFSRAEIVLINSWMPVQQIVYHMLRVFVKTELLAKRDNTSEPCALSNYNIKTLMMWACERKSRSFWTDDLNLVRICVELLHTLSVWLVDGRCPHYFIKNCNLVHTSFDLEIIARQLALIDEVCLSTWFVNNYIRKCAFLCPDNVSRLFIDIGTNKKLQNAVSATVNRRPSTAVNDKWNALVFAKNMIARDLVNYPLTVPSCLCWMTELAKTDTCLAVFFSAVAF